MSKFLNIVLLFIVSSTARADLTNLVVSWKRQDGINATKTITIAANQEATVLSVLRSYDPIMLATGGITNLVVIEGIPIRIQTDDDPIFRSQLPLRISGPAEIRVRAVVEPDSFTPGDVAHVLIVDVRDKNPSPIPSGPVVIPADAAGPVKIVLESSVALINWTDALPGTYGASTSKRFFRVRALSL